MELVARLEVEYLLAKLQAAIHLAVFVDGHCLVRTVALQVHIYCSAFLPEIVAAHHISHRYVLQQVQTFGRSDCVVAGI